MTVIISIKPEFAEKIFDGTKKFEFRRVLFKNKNVKKVIVYASSPTKKVIGEFEVGGIISKELNQLWESTKDYSGICEQFFFEYFINKEIGFAIKIRKPKRYSEPKCLKGEFGLQPPQSFAYVIE